MKASKFRDMAVTELHAGLVDINKEIYNLVNESKRARKLEKPHMLRLKKKDKARLLTILHEKQSANT